MDEIVAIIILLASVVVVLVFVGIYFYRKNHVPKVRQKGKNNKAGRAVAAMQSFARGNRFRLIAPAHLVRGDKEARLDALVVGYFGILGLVAVGYNGEIYGEANDAQWVQVTDDGRRYFDNPVLEAAADVRVIRDALFEKKLRKIPVEVLAVFTDKNAQLALPRSTGHLTVKDLKKQLRKEKYLEDTKLDLDEVEKTLRAALAGAGK